MIASLVTAGHRIVTVKYSGSLECSTLSTLRCFAQHVIQRQLTRVTVNLDPYTGVCPLGGIQKYVLLGLKPRLVVVVVVVAVVVVVIVAALEFKVLRCSPFLGSRLATPRTSSTSRTLTVGKLTSESYSPRRGRLRMKFFFVWKDLSYDFPQVHQKE